VHLVGHSYGGWTALQTAARDSARLASVTLVEPCNTVARLSGKIWWNGALLLFVGAERKARVVGKLCGNPSPGSLVENLVQLFMTAGVGFASVGTRSRDAPATPCCGRSTFLSRCYWRATQFTILRRESNAYEPWRPPRVIASGRMRHPCFRASCSMR
jgi:hypothetical protein